MLIKYFCMWCFGSKKIICLYSDIINMVYGRSTLHSKVKKKQKQKQVNNYPCTDLLGYCGYHNVRFNSTKMFEKCRFCTYNQGWPFLAFWIRINKILGYKKYYKFNFEQRMLSQAAKKCSFLSGPATKALSPLSPHLGLNALWSRLVN